MQPHRRFGFLSSEECAAILALAEALPTEPAQVLAGVSRHRYGRVAWIPSDESTRWLRDRLWRFGADYATAAGYRVTELHEFVQVARYPIDGHFDWHIDTDEDERPPKKVTIVVQLSGARDYVGGDFEFVGGHSSVFHRARGCAVAFPSFLAHRVSPVREGVRCSLAAWMNGPPFQ